MPSPCDKKLFCSKHGCPTHWPKSQPPTATSRPRPSNAGRNPNPRPDPPKTPQQPAASTPAVPPPRPSTDHSAKPAPAIVQPEKKKEKMTLRMMMRLASQKQQRVAPAVSHKVTTPSKTSGSGQAATTKAPRARTAHGGKTVGPTDSRVNKKQRISKRPDRPLEKKRRLAIEAEVEKALDKRSGSDLLQVNIRPAVPQESPVKKRPTPLLDPSTDHRRGKSPDLASTNYSGSEDEATSKLSPREKKQRLLAAARDKRLARRAARATREPQAPTPSPSPSSATFSSSSDRQGAQTTLGSPVSGHPTTTRPQLVAPNSPPASSSYSPIPAPSESVRPGKESTLLHSPRSTSHETSGSSRSRNSATKTASPIPRGIAVSKNGVKKRRSRKPPPETLERAVHKFILD